MATGVADALMVDTNVQVYASVAGAPLHVVALQSLEEHYRSGTEIWTSRQILREYLAVLSRPQSFTRPVPVSILVESVRYLETRYRVAEDGPEVTDQLLALMERFPTGGKQVHDANIVATMLVHGIGRLLTANPSDFARFAGLVAVLPLGVGA